MVLKFSFKIMFALSHNVYLIPDEAYYFVGTVTQQNGFTLSKQGVVESLQSYMIQSHYLSYTWKRSKVTVI